MTYPEVFHACRLMLHSKVVLVHPDYEAAQKPLESGRPLELFVDASGSGWCGSLCQRPRPKSAPTIVAIAAQPFDEMQLRWSARERELYSLWQSVTKHERFIKGLLCVV